jgi:hypothetical protein
MKTKKYERQYYRGRVGYVVIPELFKTAKRFIGYERYCNTSWFSLFLVVLMGFNLAIFITNLSKMNETSSCDNKMQNMAVSEAKEGIITAYNVGLISQTDNDPCISAYNTDICQLVDQGIGIVANNCLPENTEIEIEGLGRFVVLDKKNSRYGCEYYDIAMPSDKYIEAIQFGKQNRKVKIYD